MNPPTITNEADDSATVSFLMQTYGPTLTLDELAFVLKRKPGGVRVALSQSVESWAIRLNSEKVNLGRRVLFPAAVVADLLSKGCTLTASVITTGKVVPAAATPTPADEAAPIPRVTSRPVPRKVKTRTKNVRESDTRLGLDGALGSSAHPLACTLLTVEALAQCLHKSVASIRSDATRNQKCLPPICRLPGTKRLLWRAEDVARWLANHVEGDSQAAIEIRRPTEEISPPRRGRPTKAMQLARRR